MILNMGIIKLVHSIIYCLTLIGISLAIVSIVWDGFNWLFTDYGYQKPMPIASLYFLYHDLDI